MWLPSACRGSSSQWLPGSIASQCVDGPVALVFAVMFVSILTQQAPPICRLWFGCRLSCCSAFLSNGLVLVLEIINKTGARAWPRLVAWLLCGIVCERRCLGTCACFASIEAAITAVAALSASQEHDEDWALSGGLFLTSFVAFACFMAEVIEIAPRKDGVDPSLRESFLSTGTARNTSIEDSSSVVTHHLWTDEEKQDEWMLDDDDDDEEKGLMKYESASRRDKPRVEIVSQKATECEVCVALNSSEKATIVTVSRERLAELSTTILGDELSSKSMERASKSKARRLALALLKCNKSPTLLRGDEECRVNGVAVGFAAGLGDTLRQSYGTLASGRILYRVQVSGKWRCVKTFAQLRALVNYVNKLQRHASIVLTRPNIVDDEESPRKRASSSWIEDDPCLVEADRALRLAVRSGCQAALLFLETDVVEYTWPTRLGEPYDLVVARDEHDSVLLLWRECTLAEDKARRIEAKERVEEDAAATALNALETTTTTSPREIREDDDELGEVAYRAATLAVELMRSVGAPTSSSADVEDDVSLFERVDDDVRLLCGGDGKCAHRELVEFVNNGGGDSDKAAVPRRQWNTHKKRTVSMSMPPGPILSSQRQHSGEDHVGYFQDGSNGGAWVRLARYRNALLHTSAWRDFRDTVGILGRARPLHETGDARSARAARAATLANLHAALAVHSLLAWGAGSGRPESTRRCNLAAKYSLTTPSGTTTLGALERALLRDHVPEESERVALRQSNLGVEGGQDGVIKAVELRAALSLSSGRASSAPLAAFKPRPPDLARAQLRWAARTLIDASLSVYVGQHRVLLTDDDPGGTEERFSSATTARESSSSAPRPSQDPMTAPHLDSLFADKRRRNSVGPNDLTLVMPHHFRRHASVAARRSWTSHDVARGKRRRARRAARMRRQASDEGPETTTASKDSWNQAAHDARRRERMRKARNINEEVSAAGGTTTTARNATTSAESASTDHRGGWSSSGDESESSSNSASVIDEEDNSFLQVPPSSREDEYDREKRRQEAAFKNLIDFLSATGSSHTEAKLKLENAPGIRHPRLEYRNPDFRPALRLLPQFPQDVINDDD